MKSVVISHQHIEILRNMVAASPETEICGLLFGSGDRIEAIESTRNVADDPATGFEIDPARLIAALRAERQGGPRLMGHYHSHPNGVAVPSERDRAAAEPGRLWLILTADDARLWHADSQGFTQVNLILGGLAA